MAKLKNFKIKEKYLTSVYTREKKELKFINPITGESMVSTVFEVRGTKDHPQFERLRNYLADKGYIKIQYNWWNGDTVLKPFKVNNYTFNEHSTFYCGAALGVVIRCAKEFRSSK